MPIPVLGLHDHTKVFKEESCFLTDSSFVLIGSFMAFFMPLTIMVVTYFLTINALHSEATLCLDHLVPRPRWNGSLALGFLPNEKKLFLRRSLTLSNEQKASKVLGIVFILFVVMWCPFFVTNVLVAVCDSTICHNDIISGLHNVFVWVGYLSSAVNPLVYTLFNKTYRSAFARYVRCQYREERKPLRLILVNTIPPLVYQSALAEALVGFSSPLPSKKQQLSKRIPQESVSCLWSQWHLFFFHSQLFEHLDIVKPINWNMFPIHLCICWVQTLHTSRMKYLYCLLGCIKSSRADIYGGV